MRSEQTDTGTQDGYRGVVMELKSAKRENAWFVVNVIVSFVVLFFLIRMVLGLFSGGMRLFAATMVTILIYVLVLALYLTVAKGLMIGYLRGNGVRVSERQFPEIDAIFREHCARLGLKKLPTLYLVESGGALNAFATRMYFRDYVVMYSDLLEEAYREGRTAVSFVIGHELGHVARRHLTKSALTIFAVVLFPLRLAWSRACEYTCDEIGANLAGPGSTDGIALLAAGKGLYRRLDLDEYLDTASREKGFWVWFAEVMSTHPNLPRRIAALKRL